MYRADEPFRKIDNITAYTYGDATLPLKTSCKIIVILEEQTKASTISMGHDQRSCMNIGCCWGGGDIHIINEFFIFQDESFVNAGGVHKTVKELLLTVETHLWRRGNVQTSHPIKKAVQICAFIMLFMHCVHRLFHHRNVNVQNSLSIFISNIPAE